MDITPTNLSPLENKYVQLKFGETSPVILVATLSMKLIHGGMPPLLVSK